jgi:hypothetical protein
LVGWGPLSTNPLGGILGWRTGHRPLDQLLRRGASGPSRVRVQSAFAPPSGPSTNGFEEPKMVSSELQTWGLSAKRLRVYTDLSGLSEKWLRVYTDLSGLSEKWLRVYTDLSGLSEKWLRVYTRQRKKAPRVHCLSAKRLRVYTRVYTRTGFALTKRDRVYTRSDFSLRGVHSKRFCATLPRAIDHSSRFCTGGHPPKVSTSPILRRETRGVARSSPIRVRTLRQTHPPKVSKSPILRWRASLG